MSYSTAASAHKLNHGDIYNNSATGITDEVIANAFNMVKARIKKAGMTPPASDEILSVAENFFIKAEMIWKGRMMGDLPAGTGGSISTYDNINKSYKMFMELGNQTVDDYIASSSTSTNIYPNDTDGITRDDDVGDDFKLDQNDIPTME